MTDKQNTNISGSGGASAISAPPAADSQHRLTAPPDQISEGHTLPPPAGQADEQHLLPPPGAPGPKKNTPEPPKPGNIGLIAVITVIAFIVLFLLGIVPRLRVQPQLHDAISSQQASAMEVQVLSPQKPPRYQNVTLPGTMEAVNQTAINARTTGYIEHLYTDIGDHVKKGQLLATIATPDVLQQEVQARAQLANAQGTLAQSRAAVISQQGNLEQAQANLAHSDATLAQARQGQSQAEAQLAQAQQQAAQQQANLVQAQANENLAKVTDTRYHNLVSQGAVDQETADQEHVTYLTAAANVQALQAALNASKANTASFQAGVRSSQSNVKAFQASVVASAGAVSTARADISSSQAVVNASLANVASAAANLQRYAVLQGFNQITAPFDGVITARNIDTGSLINSGGGASSSMNIGSSQAGAANSGSAASGGGGMGSGAGSAGGSLFAIAQLDRMRIYVNMPQQDVTSIKVGDPAQVAIGAMPGQTFSGVVTRTADALDPASRTLVVEVDLPNPKHVLKPGMFAEVTFRIPTDNQGFLIPGSAIVANVNNTQVIEVTPQNTLHFQPILIGRDFGNITQILSGLNGTEQIVAQPTDGLREGEKVKIMPGAPTTSMSGAGTATSGAGAAAPKGATPAPAGAKPTTAQ